jgi:hypothetical protein
MGFHAFSLDPRTILGVGPDASMEQIHEAYRAKSKKHHPDMGGDEWAFRMVARAYEVLKATADAPSAARPWESNGADFASPGRAADWAWTRDARFRRPDDSATSAQAGGTATHDEPDEADRPGSTSATTQSPRFDSSRIRTVGVELIWTRFEKESPALLSDRDADDATLSVCMVIAWPPEELVHRTAEFPAAAETLRTLIDLFERLRNQKSVVAGRSRIGTAGSSAGSAIRMSSPPRMRSSPSARPAAPEGSPSASRPATNASRSTGMSRPMRP